MSDLFQFDSGAVFSPCRQWRYRLWRIWDAALPIAVFICMNPSTADELNDDATVARQQVRVTRWRALRFDIPPVGGVMILNAFGWRETNSLKLPGLIESGIDINGPENDKHILEVATDRNVAIVICAWGRPGHNLNGRGPALLTMLRDASVRPHALKLNADGSPQHPLYLGYDAKPFPF